MSTDANKIILRQMVIVALIVSLLVPLSYIVQWLAVTGQSMKTNQDQLIELNKASLANQQSALEFCYQLADQMLDAQGQHPAPPEIKRGDK